MFPSILTFLLLLFCTSNVTNNEMMNNQSTLWSVTTENADVTNSSNPGNDDRITNFMSNIPADTNEIPHSQKEESETVTTISTLLAYGMNSTGSTLSEDYEIVIDLKNTTPEPEALPFLRIVGDLLQMTPMFLIGVSVVQAFLNLIYA